MKKFSVKKLLISTLASASLVCAGTSVALLSDGAVEASAAEGSKVEVYQLAPNASYLLQSYVIKTAGGKLVVIDGGTDGVFADDGTEFDSNSALAADAYLPAALRAIAGKAEGEEVEVEAWFLSHAHRDHFSELGKIMSAPDTEGVTINNFYFDFPEFGTNEFPLVNSQQANLDSLKEAFDNYAAVKGQDVSYDALNGAVINAESVERGLSITVDGVKFEILQTWDLSDGYYEDVNDTSLVIRMVAGDNSVLFLNDLGIEGGERLTTTYTTADLQSDYVQLAHHGHAGMTKAQYNKFITDDTQLLWPTPSVTYSNPTDFFVDETYAWFNDNSLLDSAPTARNHFACLYDSYPTDATSVADWASVVDGMKVASFDYMEIGFEMMGAAVRTAAMDGIRFIAQVSDEAREAYGEGAKFGVIMIPANMDTTADLTITYDGGNYTASNPSALVVEAKEWWDAEACQKNGVKEGYSAFSGALVAAQEEGSVAQFPAAFYNRPITAVGFIVAEDGTIVYTSKMTRTIAYVASVESLKPAYEANEVIERVKAGATLSLSINDGQALTNLMKAYEPTLMVGGMDVHTSSAVKVSYDSDNEAAAKVVGGKIQPMANGSAKITATVTLDGSKTITVSTDVDVEVTKENEWVTLNDATVDFMAYGDGTTTSVVATTPDATATNCVKVTSNSEWGWFYLPFKEDGVFLTTRALQLKYSTFKFKVYVPATLQGNVAIPAKEILPAGATAGWYDIEISPEDLATPSINGVPTYNDVAGLFVQFRMGSDVIYVDDVLGYTLAPNYHPEQLPTPEVEVWSDGTAVWTAVEGATAYAYATDGLNFTVTNDTFVKLDGTASIKVKALGDGNYYKDSAMSQSVTYVKKDMLNACEYNVSGWIEASTAYTTITLNSSMAEQGYFAYGITTTTWTYLNLWLKKDYVSASLSNYEYVEMTVNVESGAGVKLLGANDGNAVLHTFALGKNVVRMPVSKLTEYGTYNVSNGVATFWLSGVIAMYVDNIVGIYPQETIADDGKVVLNTTGVAQVHAYNTTSSASTAADPVGEGYTKVTAAAAWAAAYLPFMENGVLLTTAQLQAKYSRFTFKVYVEGALGVDIPTRNIAVGEGWNDVVITADELSQINVNGFQNYNDIAGLFISVPAAGTTFYIGEVVGEKITAGTMVNFGNAYILGDSYSTYKGWTPDRYIYAADGSVVATDGDYYSDYSAIVNSAENTWWHKVLTATNSNLVKNDSWGGTTLCYTGYNMATDIDKTNAQNMSFLQRFINDVVSGYFDDKAIDTVFIFGGTNDAWVNGPLVQGGGESILGEPMYSGWTEADLRKVYPALCCLINNVKYYLPNAKIVVLGNVYGHNYYPESAGMTEKFAEIVDFYKVNGFDIDYIPLYLEESDLSALHPTEGGMQKISDQIIDFYS